jgi:hypothetical protein
VTLITDRIQPPHHTVPSHIRHLRSSRFLAEAHDESSSIQSRSGENGAANLAPYFFPDGKRIIFASNMADPKSGRDFDLYVVNVEEQDWNESPFIRTSTHSLCLLQTGRN